MQHGCGFVGDGGPCRGRTGGTGTGQGKCPGGSHQGQGEPAARALVVALGAPEVQLVPADPPQHAGQLLLQHQLPGVGLGGETHNTHRGSGSCPPAPRHGSPSPDPPEDEEAGDAEHDEGEAGAQSHDGQRGEGGCSEMCGGYTVSTPLEGPKTPQGRTLGTRRPHGCQHQGGGMHPLLSQEGSSTSKTQGGLSKGGAPFTQRMGRPSQRICFSAPE